MQTVDRCKEQRVRLRGNNLFQSSINRHGVIHQLSTINNQPSARLRRDEAVKVWIEDHCERLRFPRNAAFLFLRLAATLVAARESADLERHYPFVAAAP